MNCPWIHIRIYIYIYTYMFATKYGLRCANNGSVLCASNPLIARTRLHLNFVVVVVFIVLIRACAWLA